MIRRAPASTILTAGLLFATNACEPTTIMGGRFCADPPEDAEAKPDPQTSVPLPWSTGFESGFCHYAQPLGFCVRSGTGSFTLVTSPVHSGQFAAAFSVQGGGAGQDQARCVSQGIFPTAAYYGAWYYIPGPAVHSGNWSLFEFQGADASGLPDRADQSLWELSVVSPKDGGTNLRPSLRDALTGATTDTSTVSPIPVGQWFHLEVYFKRTKDTSGELTLFVDDLETAQLTGLVTDETDWQQWYVGNFANGLTPPASTVYVDDVTISAEPWSAASLDRRPPP